MIAVFPEKEFPVMTLGRVCHAADQLIAASEKCGKIFRNDIPQIPDGFLFPAEDPGKKVPYFAENSDERAAIGTFLHFGTGSVHICSLVWGKYSVASGVLQEERGLSGVFSVFDRSSSRESLPGEK